MLTSVILKTLRPRPMTTVARDSNYKNAAVIIIGDEILKGEVADTNSPFIVKSLYKLGVRVKRISVIGDEVDVISKEVRLFSDQYTYVITSGGIGPTHDDVTFEAVAKAFNEPLVPHPVLVDICSQYYNTTDLKSPGMKLAHIPKSASLTFGEDFKSGSRNYPNVSIRNVYMFPGIPQLLQKLFEKLGEKLFQSKQRFYNRVVYFNVSEQFIIQILNALVKQYPHVIFGSYPELHNSSYKVRVTMESTEEAHTIAAHDKMLEMIPKEYIVKA